MSSSELKLRSNCAHTKLSKCADSTLTKLAVFQCDVCQQEFKLEGLYGESVRIIDGQEHKDCTGKLILVMLSVGSKKNSK